MLEIRTLGGLSIYKEGVKVRELVTRKAAALLVYICVQGGQHNRSVLAELLWPESPKERTMANLRVVLFSLRKELGDYLNITREVVEINPEADVFCDANALEGALSAGHHLQVVEMYHGDFLDGFYIRGSVGFDEWQERIRERLKRCVIESLHVLISNAKEMGEYREGREYAHSLLQLDLLDERAHQELIRLLALDGQRSAALSQYENLCEVLWEELGVEPSDETRELVDQITHQVDFPGLPVKAPRHNLPIWQTSFISREEELTQIGRLLDEPSCRLITLVGPGGSGKSRLALQAASRKILDYSDGTYFVPLSPINSPDFLVPTVADVLQFKFDTHSTKLDSKNQLLDYLGNRSVLLVMDNFEHLIDGGGFISELLERTSQVKVVVTSRERLNLLGEWTYEVQGMHYPQNGDGAKVEEYNALVLFIERARQSRSSFTLTMEARPFAVRICQLVEGMPLGIELAAGWVSKLSCEAIAEEIEGSLDFLTTSKRDVPEVHRNLRAVFEQSWQLLTYKQREVFQRLSVFRGGFDRDASLQVAGADLTMLSTFIDKSLLRREGSGRYAIHELLRQYAEEKLNEQEEGGIEVRERFSRYFVDYLSNRGDRLVGSGMLEAKEEIRNEMENVRAGLQWAALHGETYKARQALIDFCAFYIIQGWHEGRDAFANLARLIKDSYVASEEMGKPDELLYMSARVHQAFFSCNLGLIDESEEISRQCLEPLRALGEAEEISICTHNLGVNALFRGEFGSAKEYLTEAIAFEKASHHIAWPTYLLWLGFVCFQMGGYEQGMAYIQESYDQFVLRGSEWGKAFAVSKMGVAATGQKEYPLAMRYHREGLAVFEKLGDRAGQGYSLSRMSLSACGLENYEDAIDYGQKGYDIFSKIGHRWGIGTSLCCIGFGYVGSGESRKARRYFYEALDRSDKNQMVPLSLFALLGLASASVLDGEDFYAARLFSYAYKHPRTLLLYRALADRWYENLEVKITEDDSVSSGENGEMAPIHAFVEEVLKDREEGQVLDM
jgi:predicted ATPase/DNA-binding SARP family transcriptional activator